MENSKLANWLQVVGSFGTVLGLVLVAAQVNQASDEIRLQIYQEQAYRQVDGELAMMGDSAIAAWEKAILRPSELSVGEVSQLWSYLSATIVPSFVTWTSHKADLVSDEDWSVQRSGVAFALDLPAGRAVWQQAKLQFPPDFAAEIDSALAARSSTDQRDLPALYRSIVESTRSLPSVEWSN